MLARKRIWSPLAYTRACRLTALLLAMVPMGALPTRALGQNISVTSPANRKTVPFPIVVSAHNTGCYGLQPVSFGYSVDDRKTLVLGKTAFDINTLEKSVTAGTHTIHFKSWTRQGICPVVSVSVSLSNSPAPVGGIPLDAVSSGILEKSNRWKWNHDAGTPGSSVGSSTYPVGNPSLDNAARQYSVSYSQHGGEIYHLSFAHDTSAHHFVYDAYVYLANPAEIQNLEMDMNQVMSDGRTVIFGTQCASGSRTWEFTTVSNGGPHWHASNLPCNPKTWAANTWHHVQIASHRDDSGVVTYDWVNLDESYAAFQNATGGSALKLGWPAGDLLLNLQFDGTSSASGSIMAYTDKLTIWRW